MLVAAVWDVLMSEARLAEEGRKEVDELIVHGRPGGLVSRGEWNMAQSRVPIALITTNRLELMMLLSTRCDNSIYSPRLLS